MADTPGSRHSSKATRRNPVLVTSVQSSHVSTALDRQNPKKLYTEAYFKACQAVEFDRLGQFAQAREAYRLVSQALSELLTAFRISRSSKVDYTCLDGRVEPGPLIQKRNEYIHRGEQLDRYMDASKTLTTHPDARKHCPHPTGNKVSTSIEPTTPSNDSDDGTDDDDFEKTQVDIYWEKAQGEVSEEKAYNDQALGYYAHAAEYFHKAFKDLEKGSPKRIFARDMFTRALDKAEALKAAQKNQNNTTTLLVVQNERPSSAPRSPTLSVAEDNRRPSLARYRASSVSSTRSLPKSMSNLSLESSEKFDAGNDIMTQRLSAAEIEVLKTTSNVNNKVFLPWIDESDLKENFSSHNNFVYNYSLTEHFEIVSDPDGSLRLSDKQLAKLGGWKRPGEFMRHPRLISTSIIQDIVTDCSFVASLCVAAAYERKFKKQLITSCIYPQDRQGQPCYNPNGKYVIKLVYNGIARKIGTVHDVVDDLLPVSREGTLMCTFSANKEELWASIIEKAYMKLMGGYDFPGSNSGIDLYCLTGWIPEHIFIHEKNFAADKVWNRILDGAKYGDVLVTIATGEMTEAEAASLGLVPTHAYAVIDIKTVEDKRFMQVKNPWSHKRWCGPYSHADNINWTPELKEALNYDPCIAEKNDDGIFWIDFESVCQHFTSIHLNWNPELFTHRWVLHSVWPENIGPKKDLYNLGDGICGGRRRRYADCRDFLGYNPQFSLTMDVPDKKPAAIWLLLSKHITVTEENTDYITLHIYNNANGGRVYYPEEPFKEGTYVNSPHILVRFNAPPGTSEYTIVVSQHEKARSLYFSLRAFSLAPFKLLEVPMRYPIEQKISGQWTEQTAGGNAWNASYLNNPQWKITVPPLTARPDTGLLLMLEAPKSFAVHLLLVEGGKRAASVSVRDILAESGPYRHGFCYCELQNISPGDYTIVASTYEADLLGQFILTVASNIQLNIEPIPTEGAGMFRKVIHGEWIVGYSAMGCPSYGNYGKNPRYLLEIRELTTVKVRLQAHKIDPVPSMNVTIYEKHPKELFGPELATSGPYTNVVQGVATGDVVLSQNDTGYIVVFATHEKDIGGEFSATIYSDRPINVRNDR
ncbi:calpain 7 [Apophysomyces ossiformis]|uniref:Calpain 7 n=1 Tax=Apophysomyces ossiformis TaxID=679940 RepID=A0A8H7ESF4_9FUNG|nr:calpain 7 [Apophysomyces ossiformis]